MIAEGLFHAASSLEDAGAPYDVLGRLYESFAQTVLIQAGVAVDLMTLCGFDNPAVEPDGQSSNQPLALGTGRMSGGGLASAV